jgi:cytochrome P450
MSHTVDLTGTVAGDLHGVLSEVAQQGPLATDVVTGATVVLRQRDLEALAHDPRLEGIGLALFDMMGIADGPLRDWYGRLMFTTEGDYHRRMRSLVSRAFTPRSVEALRATAAAMASDAVASVRQGGDLVQACSSLGTRLICRLLGVPDADVAVFTQWAEALSPVFYVMTPEQIEDATKAITELQSYVDELTTRRTSNPGRDLITALVAAEADGERLTHGETVTMIANLLVAGHDTAGSQIPCSILVALQHRDELAGVHGDDARLASAVAETMRLEPSIPAIPRTAVHRRRLPRCIGVARTRSLRPRPLYSARHTQAAELRRRYALLPGHRPGEDCRGRVLTRCTRSGSPTAPDRGSGRHSVAPRAWPQPRSTADQFRACLSRFECRRPHALTAHTP